MNPGKSFDQSSLSQVSAFPTHWYFHFLLRLSYVIFLISNLVWALEIHSNSPQHHLNLPIFILPLPPQSYIHLLRKQLHSLLRSRYRTLHRIAQHSIVFIFGCFIFTTFTHSVARHG